MSKQEAVRELANFLAGYSAQAIAELLDYEYGAAESLDTLRNAAFGLVLQDSWLATKVKAEFDQHGRLAAIRLHRQLTRSSLYDSKMYVESIQNGLRGTNGTS